MSQEVKPEHASKQTQAARQARSMDAPQPAANVKKPHALIEWGAPVALSLILAYATESLIERGLQVALPSIAIAVFYVGFYWLVRPLLVRKVDKLPEQAHEPHPALNWPLSGPIGKMGVPGLLVVFSTTAFLSALNPFQLVQQLRQILGQVRIVRRMKKGELNDPVPPDFVNQASYRLPFSGEWLVFNGGVTPTTSHSWGVFTQRFAYDFVKADNRRKRHRGRGTRLNEYFCYGQPILAAAHGEVVAVRDGIRDAPLVGFGIADFLCRDFRGNHVIIKHADGEYGFYAHLIKGSLKVSVGQQVTQGDPLALCGHSGHSSEPHLHFHLQDRADFYNAMGVPIRFDCYVNEHEAGDSFRHLTFDAENTAGETVFVERGMVVKNESGIE